MWAGDAKFSMEFCGRLSICPIEHRKQTWRRKDAASIPKKRRNVFKFAGAQVINVSIGENAGSGQFQLQRRLNAFQYRSASPQCDGDHDELIFVDEFFPGELRDDSSAPENRHIRPGSAFQGADFIRQPVFHQPGVGPGCLF